MSKGLIAQAAELLGWGAEDDGGRVRPHAELHSEDHTIAHFPRATENINCPIVRAEPHTLDEAASIADEIKRQNPVILNLEGVDKIEARRIRDFLSGVTYGLNGYISKVSSWVFICAPFDMPVEKLVLDPSRSGWDRFEAEQDLNFAD
jgi:FtsZ-interacting cell division protein YlmF